MQWVKNLKNLWYMVRGNGGMKIIPAHKKYQERVAAVSTMDKEQAESFVTRIRMRTKHMMENYTNSME